MNEISLLNDTELVREVKNGNYYAFENLVKRHDKQIFSVAARYVNNAEDAKDIYQEVFLRVYKSIGKFQFRSEFSTWLYRITTNVCLSYFKKNRMQRTVKSSISDEVSNAEILQKEHSNTSHQHLTNTEISDRISDALNLLSPQQKLIFILRHYEGYKIREIAGFIKCTEGTVKKQLFNAVRRLRADLKDLYLEGAL